MSSSLFIRSFVKHAFIVHLSETISIACCASKVTHRFPGLPIENPCRAVVSRAVAGEALVALYREVRRHWALAS